MVCSQRPCWLSKGEGRERRGSWKGGGSLLAGQRRARVCQVRASAPSAVCPKAHGVTHRHRLELVGPGGNVNSTAQSLDCAGQFLIPSEPQCTHLQNGIMLPTSQGCRETKARKSA